MDEMLDLYTDRFRTALEKTQRKMRQTVFTKMGSDLTMPQFFMLFMISQEGASKQTQLAEKMGVKPSAITVMIDRLAQSGHVVRKHHETDRRVVIVELTPLGQDVMKKVENSYKEMLARGLSQLPADELKTFIEVFEKLAAYY